MHFRKDLYFQKKNRGRHVLYCCSAHASWSPFPRKDLRFHKNNRGQGVLYYCSGYASLLPHQSDLQRRQKNRQKKSCSWPHCHKPRNQLFYTQAKPLPPVSAFCSQPESVSALCSQPESVSALCSQPDFVSLHKQEKGHQDLPVRYYPYGPVISGCSPRSAIYIQRIIRFVIMNSALFFHSHLSFNRFPSHFSHKTAPCAGTILIIS